MDLKLSLPHVTQHIRPTASSPQAWSVLCHLLRPASEQGLLWSEDLLDVPGLVTQKALLHFQAFFFFNFIVLFYFLNRRR